MADLSRRFNANPILSPMDIPPSQPGMKVECVLNPGAFHYDGRIWLILRVAERPVQKAGKVSFPILNEDNEFEILEFETEDPRVDLSDPRYVTYNGMTYLSTVSHLRLVCSDDGKHFHEPDDVTTRIFGKGQLESFGIEDCRVTELDDGFVLTFTAVSGNGVGVGLIETENWKEFDRKGMILPPHNKDCAIFSEKINGQYYCLHRPSGIDIGGNYIWVANSKDRTHWGQHKCILTTRRGCWDSVRVGAGAAPIRTESGWLEIYHGADQDNRYCLGAILLDINDPSIVLARSAEPIMEPDMPYEQEGFFGNVIFTNGHVRNGDTLTLYYGASDTVICGAEFSIEEILDSLQ